MSIRHPTIIIVILLAGAVLVRGILFFGGVRGADAYAYAYEAYNIATGHYDVQADTAYYGFRFSVLLPTALAYRLLGVSDWSSAFFPLLASLGTLLLVVRLGMILFDRPTGFAAGGLYLFLPLDLPSATLLGPSSFIPFLSAMALYCIGRQMENGNSSVQRTWELVVAGLCIGLACQARESSFLLMGSVGAILLSYRLWSWKVLWVPIGCSIPLLLESSYYWIETGDPLYRWSVIQQLNDLYAADIVRGSQTYFIGGPTSWLYYPAAMFGWDLGGFAWFGFFVYLAFGTVCLAWYHGTLRSLCPLLMWMAPPLFYLEFGSVSLLRYVPLPKGYHYMSLISVPLVLLCAHGMTLSYRLAKTGQLWRGVTLPASWQKASVLCVLIGLITTSCYGTYRVLENIRADARPFEQVASIVKAHPERPIYVTHFRWTIFLSYFLGYQTEVNYYARNVDHSEGRLRSLLAVRRLEELPAAYIVLHDRYLYYDTVGLPIARNTVVSDDVFASLGALPVVAEDVGEPSYNSFRLVEWGGPRTATVTAIPER